GKAGTANQVAAAGGDFPAGLVACRGALGLCRLGSGLTHLYTYDLNTAQLRRLTNDAFTDLQPAWSPDGRRLAFVTNRFSSDLGLLRFGAYQLALLDLQTGSLAPLPAFGGTKNIDPH